jgi:putative membrane protein
VLLILTLPINILTLGLFTFVINALLLMMASGVIAGFNVRGFWSAVGGALIVSAVNWLISAALNRRGGAHYIEMRRGKNDRWE